MKNYPTSHLDSDTWFSSGSISKLRGLTTEILSRNWGDKLPYLNKTGEYGSKMPAAQPIWDTYQMSNEETPTREKVGPFWALVNLRLDTPSGVSVLLRYANYPDLKLISRKTYFHLIAKKRCVWRTFSHKNSSYGKRLTVLNPVKLNEH